MFLLIPLLIGGAVLSALFAYLTTARFEEQLQEKQAQYAKFHETAVAYALWHYDLRSIEHLVQALSFDRDLIRVAVKDRRGKTLAKVDKTDGELPSDARVMQRDVIFDDANSGRVLGQVILVFDDSRIMAEVQRQVIRDTALTGLLMLAIAASALAAHRWLVDRPLRRFFHAFQQTRADGVLHRVEKVADDEIGAVAESYNRMLDRIAADEAELTRAKETAEAATRAKADFLANVSHEIRTPMNAILGMTRLLGKTEVSPSQEDYLAKINASAEHLLVLINDILDFSKIEAGKLEFENTAFAVESVLSDVADMTRPRADEKAIQLQFHTAPDVPDIVRGDPHRIGQILLNLTSNAVKFTERGHVRISTQAVRDDGERVWLRFSVADTGIGMDANQRGRLFTAFSQADTSTTRRYGGTGLGLAICQRLIALMGGDIDVESEPNRGTTIWVTLPLERASKRDLPEEAATTSPVDLRDWGALVVDPDAARRERLGQKLADRGARVDPVTASAPAVLKAREARNADAPYDLLLVYQDLVGADGMATMQRIRQMFNARPPLCVLLAGSESASDTHATALQSGVDAICYQPVTNQSLDTALREAGGWAAPKSLQPASEAELSDADRARLESARVLLVEDNDINQQVCKELLESVGVTADVAGDGQEALSVAEAEPPDVILMDVQMPVMDGYAATRALRRHATLADRPVVALTAHAMSGERDNCLTAGMDDYLSKPIEDIQLYRTLLNWLPAQPEGMRGSGDGGARADAAPGHGEAAQTDPESEGQDRGANAAVAANRPGEAPDRDPATGAADASASGAAAELPSALPGIDVTTGLRYVANKPELYKRTAERFFNRYSEGAAELHDLMAARDRDGAHRWAHSLKNLAGTLGASELRERAYEVERALADADDTAPQIDVDALDNELWRVIGSLADLLGKPKPGATNPAPDRAQTGS
jgi:two-component system sensor histidine kinase/response regulator